ncbi:MAG: GNAT family protein [Candidatus Nanoarchaeia archaeon]|nr:GNAT family protein [Candidatus Nanoarchaeia archaeon]
MEKIFIGGKRINLRTPEVKDAESIKEYAQDKSISKYTVHIPYPYRIEDALSFIKKNREKLEKKEEYSLGIELNKEIVGMVSLFNINYKNKNAELGYWIGKPFRGKGYASEAAKMIIDFGFNKLGFRRIFAKLNHENTDSIKVLERIGFKYEGRLTKHRFQNGRYCDELRYGLLKEEFND